jgi:hypothetical protein
MNLPIQEETLLSALRENEPAAAAVVDRLLPALAAMANPDLRRVAEAHLTVTRAAEMAGIPTAHLLQQLRAVTGQTPQPVLESDAPAWLSPDRVETFIDATAMLRTGEHPIGKVRESAAALSPGGIVKLTAPFKPIPLLDTMARAGYSVFCREASGEFEVFIARV